jgi:hypothetical protein
MKCAEVINDSAFFMNGDRQTGIKSLCASFFLCDSLWLKKIQTKKVFFNPSLVAKSQINLLGFTTFARIKFAFPYVLLFFFVILCGNKKYKPGYLIY